jgi:D-3-phosphoglycerate dehydrogenase
LHTNASFLDGDAASSFSHGQTRPEPGHSARSGREIGQSGGSTTGEDDTVAEDRRFQILAIGTFHEAGLSLLRNAPDIALTVVSPDDRAAVEAALPRMDAVSVRNFPLDADILSKAGRLSVVAKHGIGTDNIALDHLTARGIPVAIATGSNDRSVAEWTIMAIMALAKRALTMDGWTRRGDWHRRLDNSAMDVAERTLLIVGFGRIGRRVAAMARALDMRVLAYDAMAIADAGPADRIVGSLEEGLREADFVSLHVPATPRTLGLLGAAAFEAMKPGAYLVNAARGGVVDEAALAATLDAGHLAGAALDVLAQEPPSPDHPLLKHPKVLLSPHAAALTEEGAIRMATMTAENLLAAKSGSLDPRHVVNAEVLRAS